MPLTRFHLGRRDGHDASVERQESQQLGNGGDLVGLPLHLDLAQRHAVGRSPRAHQVNGLLAPGPVVGAAHRLTVNGHHFTLGQSGHLLGPPHKQLWNCSGSRRENTSQKVSWDGMPLGSSKKLLNHSSLLRPNISICTHESAPPGALTPPGALMLLPPSRPDPQVSWASPPSGWWRYFPFPLHKQTLRLSYSVRFSRRQSCRGPHPIVPDPCTRRTPPAAPRQTASAIHAIQLAEADNGVASRPVAKNGTRV